MLALARLELTVRSRPLPRLCADAGVGFTGFAPPPGAVDDQPLPRQVADAWWAVEVVLRRWPWARQRPCLRRSLLLGRRLADLSPSLALEITGLRPLAAHAVLVVRGHRLDMGDLADDLDAVPSPPVPGSAANGETAGDAP